MKLSTAAVMLLAATMTNAEMVKRTCKAKNVGAVKHAANVGAVTPRESSSEPVARESETPTPKADESGSPAGASVSLELGSPEQDEKTIEESGQGNQTSQSSGSQASPKGAVGIAWDPENEQGATSNLGAAASASWYWNWGPSPVDGMPSGIEFVPTLWDAKSDVAGFVDSILAMEPKPSFVMGPNECDMAEQCGMEADAVASVYRDHLSKLRDSDIQVSSPAIASDHEWLSDFFAACGNDCPVDFMAVHTYGYANMEHLMNNVGKFHEDYPDYQIWVTEWAVTTESGASAGDISTYLADSTKWFQEQDWIDRYSWFITGSIDEGDYVSADCSLMNPTGGLTPLGKSYFQ